MVHGHGRPVALGSGGAPGPGPDLGRPRAPEEKPISSTPKVGFENFESQTEIRKLALNPKLRGIGKSLLDQKLVLKS